MPDEIVTVRMSKKDLNSLAELDAACDKMHEEWCRVHHALTIMLSLTCIEEHREFLLAMAEDADEGLEEPMYVEAMGKFFQQVDEVQEQYKTFICPKEET